MTKVKAILALAAFSAMAFSQENLSTWSSYKIISFNTKASGAGVTTAQAKFPVLIRLTAANADVFNGALATGADVRFTTMAGKSVPYQIEQWDKASATAAIWVLADTVKGNDSVATLKMYWGKAGAADNSNGSMVFDTANGFQGVFHLNEATGDPAKDATMNSYSATALQVGTTGLPKDTIGLIGQSKKFNGNSGNSAGSYYNIQNSASGKLNFLKGDNYSISAWVYCEMVDNQFRMIVCKHDNQYTISTKWGNGVCNWEFNTYTNKGWEDVYAPALGNQWVHVVGVRNGTAGTEVLYANGAVIQSTIQNNGGGGNQNTSTNVFIGAMPGSPAQRYWAGRLDEVQMSNTERSADWIKLGYLNQKAAQSLVVVGATVSNTSIKLPQSLSSSALSSSVKLLVKGMVPVVYNVPAAIDSKMQLRIVDVNGKTVWSQIIDVTNSNQCTIAWDGKSFDRGHVASGMYIARMVFSHVSSGAVGNVDKKITLL